MERFDAREPARRAAAVRSLAAAVAVAGASLSFLLLSVHVLEGGGSAEGLCGEGGGCGAVLSSKWAVFPPPLPGVLPDGGVPVAFLGLAWFLAALAFVGLVGVPGAARRAWADGFALAAAFSASASIAYVALMARVLDVWCPLCLGAHGCNLALLVAAFLLRRRAALAPAADPLHPRPALAAAAGLAAALAAALAWTALALVETGRGRDRAVAAVTELRRTAGLVEAAYLADDTFTRDEEARARFDRVVRPDDARLEASPGAHMTLVVFSDVECPSCLQFERLLTTTILPAFAGHLEVVHKHFPLADHPNALEAAVALEAARLQGRFHAFKDRLLDRAGDLADVDLAAVAADVGFDVARFERDRASDEALARVREDKESGRELGVEGTPAVFLNRRPVPAGIRHLAGFWELRAAALRRAREARGEEW